MKLNETILTKNPCYTAGKKITVKGLMIHSVGCSQPSAQVFVKSWNSAAHDDSCVHAFLEPDGDVYQCLPWNHYGWHGGKGANGSVNSTHIGVEMTEPATIRYTGGASWVETADGTNTKNHVLGTYKTAVELFAYLCDMFNLNPLADGVIISHSEGHKRGIASNHSDVEHIWSKFGLTMAQFRKDIQAAMKKVPAPEKTITNEEIIWNFLKGKGLNDFAVAGLMGNLFAESALNPCNLQNSYEKSLNMTDATYTKAVDDGTYTNFVRDSAGYGLAQWTFWSRKQALLDFAKAAGTSIGYLTMQLDFLWKELQGYTVVINDLKAANSIVDASNAVLIGFERPADQGAAVQKKRAGYSQTYYDKFAKKADEPQNGVIYRVQVGAYSIKSNAEAILAKLKAAGFDAIITAYEAATVAPPKKSIDEIAREVISGEWGNGDERKQRLTAAGHEASAVQARVNEILK